MRSLWIAWRWPARRGPHQSGDWPRRLAAALMLALLLCLAMGTERALAASPAFAGGGTLTIKQPNYRGVIGGPPGTRVTVEGFSWRAYSTLTLSVTSGGNCGGVPVGAYPTDQFGHFSAGFLWPAQANRLGTYHVCASQPNYGSALSNNAFSVLASSPPSLAFSPGSLVAGDVLTVIGKNWVPGPQTVTLVVVPCNTICNAAPIAQTTLVTADDGTFSQKLPISASAPTGAYYIRAANSLATLATPPAGPIQVAGQASSSGTPVPGVSPTTIATRTNQDSTGAPTISPISQASSSLKNALLAAGLGLVALLVMIGGLAFFIGRSRGPDLPPSSRSGKGNEPSLAPPKPPRRATWRTAVPAATAAHQPSGAPALPQPYQGEEGLSGEDEPTTPEAEAEAYAARQASEDEYPWEEQIPPPQPGPESEGRGSSPRQWPGAPGHPQVHPHTGQLPQVRRPSETPTQFMPPRRSHRFRPSEERYEQ
jgi:hypothetical protein